MEQEQQITEESRRELENAIRGMVQKGLTKAEADRAEKELYARWPAHEVEAATKRVLKEMTKQQKFEARGEIPRYVYVGFFLWIGFALLTRGFGQLAHRQFWVYFVLSFIPVNLVAYLVMATVYEILHRLVSRKWFPVEIAAGLGCVLPIVYIAVSILLNRMVYLRIM